MSVANNREQPDRQLAANIASTATDTPTPSADRSFFGHPRGLSTLFFTEMWERFSYYGLRPLLVLFMSAALLDGGFGFDTGEASAIVGIYGACVYLASLPGGWVADRLLGLRRAIMFGAVLISAGHISIGLSAFAGGKVPFFLGLILIVLGTGLLKPNISAIVGDLYPEGGARRDAGFSIFYMGINIGAFAGQLITGYLGEQVGWHFGFGAAGVGMLFGLAIFSMRARATLGDIGMAPTRHADPATQDRQVRTVKTVVGAGLAILALVVVLTATGTITIQAQVIGRYMAGVMLAMAVAFFLFVFSAGGLDRDEKKRVGVILILFLFAIIFWSAFEQAPTSLNLFARDFTDRQMGGFEVPATWFQSINSAFIILFAPVFAAIWVGLARRGGDLSSPAKFSVGLLLAGVGFFIMIYAANAVVSSGGTLKVSPWWLVGSYFFQTLGELSLSPVGLSSMTKLSPRKYVGQMMGIWFLASALGNLVGGLVGGHVDPNNLQQMPKLFTWTTIALVVAAAVLAALIIPIRRMMVGTDRPAQT
ncbi:MAG: peptide MFS transporter [Gemmatimonadaceae bacterium]|nr:peptide MFS transporter [Gemmatimonadaceae bacterium]MDQ3518672.1 peptide MFS transporter [Gemmatimonadota bacterium]